MLSRQRHHHHNGKRVRYRTNTALRHVEHNKTLAFFSGVFCITVTDIYLFIFFKQNCFYVYVREIESDELNIVHPVNHMRVESTTLLPTCGRENSLNDFYSRS